MIPDEVLKSGRELKLLWANGYGESTKPSADVYDENLNPFSVSFYCRLHSFDALVLD